MRSPPATSSPGAPVCPPCSSWSFTQGFIAGQAVFVITGALIVYYLWFTACAVPSVEEWRVRRDGQRRKDQKSLLSDVPVPPLPTHKVLEAVGYDMDRHLPESADWVNVIAAQLIQGYRNDFLAGSGEEGARRQFEKWLNPPGVKLSWLDRIKVTALNLGNSYPLLSNARIRQADDKGNVRLEIDLDYVDSVSMTVSTQFVVNFPRARFAVLPVTVGVRLVSVGGTLSLTLHNPKNEPQHIHMSLLPDYHLNLKTSSLLGSVAKIQDIPKLEQILVTRLRAVINDRLVLPRHITLALPRLIPQPDVPSVPTQLHTELDIRTLATGMLGRGIGALGQSLAERVASLGSPVTPTAEGAASITEAGEEAASPRGRIMAPPPVRSETNPPAYEAVKTLSPDPVAQSAPVSRAASINIPVPGDPPVSDEKAADPTGFEVERAESLHESEGSSFVAVDHSDAIEVADGAAVDDQAVIPEAPALMLDANVTDEPDSEEVKVSDWVPPPSPPLAKGAARRMPPVLASEGEQVRRRTLPPVSAGLEKPVQAVPAGRRMPPVLPREEA